MEGEMIQTTHPPTDLKNDTQQFNLQSCRSSAEVQHYAPTKKRKISTADSTDCSGEQDLETSSSKVNKVSDIVCHVCGKYFKTQSSRSKHLKNIHGVNAKGIEVIRPVKEKVTCVFCDKMYSNAFTLERHIETIHLYEETNPVVYRCSECNYKTFHKHSLLKHAATHTKECQAQRPIHKCHACTAKYTHKRNLNRHKRKVHGLKTNNYSICRQCPLCSFSSATVSKEEIYKHFAEEHYVTINWEHYEFENLNQFQQWKEGIEKTTMTSYVKATCSLEDQFVYKCNRCGVHKSIGRGLRHPKRQGSCKINAFCPAEIRVIVKSECVKVKFLATHVGHRNQIQYTRLSLQDRQAIALKLINKTPKKEILRSIRASLVNGELKRLHLVNAADINNIKASLNLHDEARKHQSDVVSTEAWVAELKESKNTSVLAYKAQGDNNDQFPGFHEKDFLLIYMTKVQKLVLEKHGRELVCVDSTFGMNNYNFQMYTLLTLDESREGFPVAFMFTNRSDEMALETFYSEIRKVTGPLNSKTFMSDMDEVLYSAWAKTMGPAERRLFCAWHVIRAIKKNIGKKIKNPVKREMANSIVTALIYERDESAFLTLLETFLENIKNDEDTRVFYEYLNEYYVKSEKYKLWAYCYRLHRGINTNMSLENFNKVIKYFYLGGRKVLRMDQAIFAVKSFITDKVFDLIIKQTKGKISTKMKYLRKSHKNSRFIDPEVITETNENTWQVLSSKQTEFYEVKKVNNCRSCQLQCFHCGTCLHEYFCSCFDNSIKNNMCKHIHAVCKKYSPHSISDQVTEERIPMEEILNEIAEEEEEENLLVATGDKVVEELKAMLTALKPEIVCEEQIEFLKTEATKIQTVVQAIRASKGKNMEEQPSVNKKSKLEPQRKFSSTKKKPELKKPLNNSYHFVTDLMFNNQK